MKKGADSTGKVMHLSEFSLGGAHGEREPITGVCSAGGAPAGSRDRVRVPCHWFREREF